MAPWPDHKEWHTVHSYFFVHISLPFFLEITSINNLQTSNMIFAYASQGEKDARFIIKANDRLLVCICLTKKQIPEIQITHLSFSRKMKIILTREQCDSLFDLSPQVIAIMNHLERNVRESNPSRQSILPSSPVIEMPVDGKKLLSITIHRGQSLVRVDTRSKGNFQRRLGFSFQLCEWESLLSVKNDLYHAIRHIKQASDNARSSSSTT